MSNERGDYLWDARQSVRAALSQYPCLSAADKMGVLQAAFNEEELRRIQEGPPMRMTPLLRAVIENMTSYNPYDDCLKPGVLPETR